MVFFNNTTFCCPVPLLLARCPGTLQQWWWLIVPWSHSKLGENNIPTLLNLRKMVLKLFHFLGSSPVRLCRVPLASVQIDGKVGGKCCQVWAFRWSQLGFTGRMWKQLFFPLPFGLWQLRLAENSLIYIHLSFQHPLVHPHFHSLHAINLSAEKSAHVWGFAFLLFALCKGARRQQHLWAGSQPREMLSGGSIIFWLTLSSSMGSTGSSGDLLPRSLRYPPGFTLMSARRAIPHYCAVQRGATSVWDLRPELLAAKLVPTIMLALWIALTYKNPQGKLMYYFASLQQCCVCRAKTILWVFKLCQVEFISRE